METTLYHAMTVPELRARTLKVGDVLTLPADSQFSTTEWEPVRTNDVPFFMELSMDIEAEHKGEPCLLRKDTTVVVTALRLKMSESDGAPENLHVKVTLEGGPGSGNYSHAGRPGEVGGSSPGGGKGASKQPPALDWEDPPAPGKGRDPNVKGGMTATGETNTKIGDLGETLLVKQLGMESLIPKGQRQNPLDMRWDGSKQAYEVKTITTDAKEFKIKMKAAEVESKLAYAKANGYKPGMIMLVIDRKTNTGYAYKRDGIGSYRLNDKDWQFMGRLKVGGKKKEDFDEGGPGSGHFGHAGRPGEVGGSAPGGGDGQVKELNSDDRYHLKWWSEKGYELVNAAELDKPGRSADSAAMDRRVQQAFYDALDKLPPVQKTVMQGTAVSEKELARLKVGTELNFKRTVSATSSEEVANEFAAATRINTKAKSALVFVLDAKSARDISAYGNHPDEAEHILCKGTKFKITNIKRDTVTVRDPERSWTTKTVTVPRVLVTAKET